MTIINTMLESISRHFSWSEAISLGQPLIIFVLGIAIYAIFIFKFYKFLARKDIFTLDLRDHSDSEHPALLSTFDVLSYIIKYIIVFPIITFFWFLTVSIILVFLAKNQALETIFLVSVALVSAVRITAYYNEDLSKDLAKMLPFVLLGVFIIDISFFSLLDSLRVIGQIPKLWELTVYYLIFLIIIETVMKFLDMVFEPFSNKEKKE